MVISRAESCPISKGCRVSRHPSDVKDHPMNRIRKITGATGGRANRTEYCIEAARSAIREEIPGCRETRHPGMFAMYFCPVIPIIHFPGSAFPLCVYKGRLHDVENRKHAMVCSAFAAFAGGRHRASGYRLAADRAGEKNANVINRYHNVTS